MDSKPQLDTGGLHLTNSKSIGIGNVAVEKRLKPNQSRRPTSVPTNRLQGSDPMFGKISVSLNLSKAIREMGYISPTPIQESVIPPVKEGRDVVGQAQTGTGKTAAFGIPLIETLSKDATGIEGLILVPTRELAVQVKNELTKLGKFKGIRNLAVYGGQAIATQINALKQNPQVIVATPGRLIDHIERGTVNLGNLKFVVLDEADQMLDIGFADDIRWILNKTPRSRQTLLFSATMPTLIKRLSNRYMKDPIWILVGGESEPVDQVDQIYYEVAERDRYFAIEELLSDNDVIQALVFRRTKIGVDRLATHLKRKGHDAQAIHGDISQSGRDAVMGMFRSKKLRVLIATNVAARGLDIPAVSHVINYDMPDNVEDYVHRIGRTARMGKHGTAITFVSEYDFEMLAALQSHVGDGLKSERLVLYGG